MENVLGVIVAFEWIWIIIFVIVIVSVIAAVRKRKKKSIGIGLEDIGSDSNEIQTKNEKPLKIIQQRLAKGEITKEEYDELKKEFDQELQLNIKEGQVNTQTITQDDTQFWVCPDCGGDTQSRNGKQFCSKCNVYL